MLGLGVVMVLVFGALVVRLVSLQVTPPAKYLEFSEEQRLKAIDLPATRGPIVDRNGAELALSIPQPSLYANPQLITDIAGTATQLAALVTTRTEGDLEHALLQAQATDLQFVWLARVVTPERATQVLDLKMPGIFSIDEPKRFLTTGGNSAAAVVGHTDIDNKGLSGLEKQFGDILAGTAGKMIVEKGSQGRTIPGGVHELQPAVPGSTLILSLDRGLQFETERLLKQYVDQLAARGGTVLVGDSESGEILAAASVTRADGQPAEVADTNWAATYTFEPGSISKAITMSAAIQEGLVAPDTPIDVAKQISIAGSTFADETGLGGTPATVTDIFAKSSNTGTIAVAQQLGPQKLFDYFQKFGLGSRTGTKIPQEEKGNLPPDPSKTQWSDTTLPTVAIGQGYSTTPLQMLSVYNTIANDGVRVTPRFVRGTQSPGGSFTPEPAADSVQVMSADTAKKMRSMLQTVVETGTGKKAKVAGFDVGGKTGTAWKALNKNSKDGYVDEAGRRHYVTSFAGMLPADDPKLTIVVVIDDPQVANASGGALSAPLFSEVASYAVRSLRIAPSKAATGSVTNRVIAPIVVPVTASASATDTAAAAKPTGTTTTATTTKPATTTVKAAPTTTKPPSATKATTTTVKAPAGSATGAGRATG
jgi:cell division protein FtsI (penicillin-binding protein 3)